MPPTDHGGRNGHIGQRQQLHWSVCILNWLNWYAVSRFYLILPITLSLASISVCYHGGNVHQYYLSWLPFWCPPPWTLATRPAAFDRGGREFSKKPWFDPIGHTLAWGRGDARHGRCLLSKKRYTVQKIKWSTQGSIFEDAQLLPISKFVDASRIYVVEREQSLHNYYHK